MALLCGCSKQDPSTGAPPDSGADAGSATDGGSHDEGGYYDGGGSTSSSGCDAGSASDGGASVPAWLCAPELWEPVPEPVPCDVHRAKLPTDKVPRRVWSPCGLGCRVAPAPLLGFMSSANHEVVAKTIGGEIYYRVGSQADAHSGIPSLDEVSRLSDDTPVTLLKRSSECMGGSDFDSPLVFVLHVNPWVNSPGEPTTVVGVGAPAVGASVQWALPPAELPGAFSQMFDFSAGWGHVASQSFVQVATTPGSSALVTIHSGLSYQEDPVARGLLLVWTDWDGWSPPDGAYARLRSWTQAGGIEVLAGGPWNAMRAALSDSKLVWLATTGPQAIAGEYESVQLFWSPLATSPEKVQVNAGPVVPHWGFPPGRLTTFGNLAALVVNNEQDKPNVVAVADLITKKIWLIMERPGMILVDVMAMNATELLVKEYTKGKNIQFPERILRFDLSKLDELAGGAQ